MPVCGMLPEMRIGEDSPEMWAVEESPEMRLAAIHSYEEAAQEFQNAHGFRISADTMRDIVIDGATCVQKFNLTCGQAEEKQRETLAYVLGDGTGISMFRKHLAYTKISSRFISRYWTSTMRLNT